MNATIKLGLSSVLLMLAAAYAPAVSAQVVTGPIKNTGNFRCLAVNTLVITGAPVTQTCNAASAIQKWVQTPNPGPPFFQIKNVGTGRCLDISPAGVLSTSACNLAIASQRWQRLNTGATTARFRSVPTGRYLESTPAGAVFSNLAPGGNPQIWAF